VTAFIASRPLRISVTASVSVDGSSSYEEGTPAATAFTLTGPTSGTAGIPALFTVIPNGSIAGTVVVTPVATNGGSVSPSTLTFTATEAAQTFTVTRSVGGVSSVSITNNGSLSNVGTPISFTVAASTEVTWSSLIPNSQGFTEGAAGTYGLVQHTSNFNSSVHRFEVATGTLPTGLTLNQSTGYVYDGVGPAASVSTISINIADIISPLQADWIARSTASGVTAAYDFNGANDFVLATTNNGHVYAGSMNPTVLGYIVKDTTDGLASGCCLRIDTPASVGANSATWMCSLNNAWTTKTQGFGSTAFWIQFRFKIPSSRLTLTNCGGNQRGWKWANVAHYSQIDPAAQSASNRNDEHVLQDTNQYGFPQAYHRDVDGNFPAFNESYGGSNFKLQNSIDNGTGLSDNNRYCLWNSGSPSAGCWDWVADEWLTCMIRIKVGTYGGSAGNEFDMWVARRLATSWTHTHSFSNYSVGLPDEFTGGLNGLHLLTYETNRINSTVATHHKYAELIVSTQEIALPAPI
jgi:hypothetical protein